MDVTVALDWFYEISGAVLTAYLMTVDDRTIENKLVLLISTSITLLTFVLKRILKGNSKFKSKRKINWLKVFETLVVIVYAYSLTFLDNRFEPSLAGISFVFIVPLFVIIGVCQGKYIRT